MNKAYRLIWSKVKDAWVIVAEIVKGNGGPPPLTVAALIAATMALVAAGAEAGSAAPPSNTLPTGQQVVSGTVNFNFNAGATTFGGKTYNNTLIITNSPNAIINWQGFSIGSDARTQIIQQSADSNILHRVIGSTKSDIFGLLDSNGRVFLLNPNGILFGAGSKVDVAGLVASSLGMTNRDFLDGKYRFNGGAGSGSIINEGTITTAAGGKVWLIAPQVENSSTGIITAPNGDVVLAAGQRVNMIDPDNPEIAVVVSAPTDKALNLGKITATAGRVGIFGGLVEQSGIISADGAEVGPDGRIFLKSTKGTTLSSGSQTTAFNAGGYDGSIQIESSEGAITQAGTVKASNDVNLVADAMTLAGGTINAPTVRLDRASWGDVDLGSKTTPAALGLDQADLNSITADNLSFTGAEGSNINNIAISKPLTFTTVGNLNLYAYNNIDQNGSLTSNGSVSFAADTINQNAALTATGGSVTFSSSNFNQTVDGSIKSDNFVTIAADAIDLQGSTEAPVVTLTRNSWGNIYLGNPDISENYLGLVQEELDTITASTALRIGDASNVNAIYVDDPIARNGGAGKDTLHLISGNGGISQSNPLQVTNLALESTGNIILNNADNAISKLAVANTYGGAITSVENIAATPLEIGAVDGITGITSAGSVYLKTDALTISEAVNASGDVGLKTDDLTINAPVTANYVTLTPRSEGRDITLGNKSAGTLGLSNPELGYIYSDELSIGDSSSGNINITGAVTLLNSNSLWLTPGSGKAFNQSAALSAPGTIGIIADNMNLSGGINSEYVYLWNSTPGRNIDLISNITTKTGSNLELNDTELYSINANELNIGSYYGNVNFNTPLDFTPADRAKGLYVWAGAGIINQNQAVTVPSTIAFSAGTINQVAKLEATDAVNGNIYLAADNMFLSTVSGGGASAQTVTLDRASLGDVTIDTVKSAGVLTTAELGNISATNLNIGAGNINNLNQNANVSVSGSITLQAGSFNQNSGKTLTAGNSATIAADNMSLGGTTAAPVVTLTRNSWGFIELGASDVGSDTLGLAQADLDTITASSSLRIGDQSNVDSIFVSGPITRNTTGKDTLHLISGNGGIDQSSSLEVTKLAVESGGDINLYASGNKIGTLAASAGLSSSYGGSVGIVNDVATPLTIGSVDGVTGITAAGSGAVWLRTDDLTINSDVQANYVSVTPTTLYRNITLGNKTGGTTLGLTNVELNKIYSGGLAIGDSTSGDINVTGAVTLDNSSSLWLMPGSGKAFNQSASLALTTSGADIGISADKMSLSGGITAGYVYLMNSTPGTDINLISSSTTKTGSSLELKDTELYSIKTNRLSIGNGNVGNVNFNTALDFTQPNRANGLSVVTNGNVALNSSLNVGSGDLTLNTASGSTSTQSAGAIITAGGLELVGGSFALNEANKVDTLAASLDYSSTLSFKNDKTLTIGNVGGTYGLYAGTGISLDVAGDLTIDQYVQTSNLTLTSSGSVTQKEWSPIYAGNLHLLGSGSYNLSNVDNEIYTLDGIVGSVTLKNNGQLIVYGLTATNDIDLTAKGRYNQEDGIRVEGPLQAANIRLDGTGSDGSGYGGGIGVDINSSVTADGNVTIIGHGGQGSASYNGWTPGYAGGAGIRIASSGSVVSNGSSANEVYLEGHGGRGGDAFGYYWSNNGKAQGGNGGVGIQNNGQIGSNSQQANIRLIGIGGKGGNAAGGYGYNTYSGYGNGGSGGNATGGAGGIGIAIGDSWDGAGHIATDSGNITLIGNGGSGGWGRGGDGGMGGGYSSEMSVNYAAGNGGVGTGGAGGVGINVVGNNSEGTSYSGIYTRSGNIKLFGNVAIDEIGALVKDGFGNNIHAGGNGGHGYGGRGGDAIYGASFGQGFSGADGGLGVGGAGGDGIAVGMAYVVATQSGSVAVEGHGGLGGTGFGGDGGRGGESYSWSTSGSGGRGGDAKGGAGGRGVVITTNAGEGYIYSSGGTIDATGFGGAGGNGVAGFGGDGGSGGAGFNGSFGSGGGSGGYGGVGGSGGNGIGGVGGGGIIIDTAGFASSPNIESVGANVTLIGSGAAGGTGFGGFGGIGGSGGSGGNGGSSTIGNGGDGGSGGNGNRGGYGGDGYGGVAGNGLTINGVIRATNHGDISLYGYGGNGGNGVGGNPGQGGFGGAGGIGGAPAATFSAGATGSSGSDGWLAGAGGGYSDANFTNKWAWYSGGHGVIINEAVRTDDGSITIIGEGGKGGDGVDGLGGFILSGNGGNGGNGVMVNADLYAYGNNYAGNISITGRGGAGGDVLGSMATAASGGFGGGATAGGGGNGIMINGGVTVESYASDRTNNITLTGSGGAGGIATAGDSGGTFQGGQATGGSGGFGIGMNGSIRGTYSSEMGGYVDITLKGIGGAGGAANGGAAAMANGGNASAGDGGSGINANGSISTDAGFISLAGLGGNGGGAIGGGFTSGYGGGVATGGDGGMGLNITNSITTYDGNVELGGKGGKGGDAKGGSYDYWNKTSGGSGGDGILMTASLRANNGSVAVGGIIEGTDENGKPAILFDSPVITEEHPVPGWAQGGDGGKAEATAGSSYAVYGGKGGTGFTFGTTSGGGSTLFADYAIVIRGKGGAGGKGTGAAAPVGGFASEGYGGDGGNGVVVNYANINSWSDITINAEGGRGGDGVDGIGGFNSGSIAYAGGGDGGDGFRLNYFGGEGSTRISAYGNVTITAKGGDGGDAFGSDAASGSGNVGGFASGGYGGDGIITQSGTHIESRGDGYTVKFDGTGGDGGYARGGSGDGSASGGGASGGWGGDGISHSGDIGNYRMTAGVVIIGKGGNGGSATGGSSSGSGWGGNATGGEGGFGAYFDGGSVYNSSGNITITGSGGNGGFGKGGDAGAFGSGGDGHGGHGGHGVYLWSGNVESSSGDISITGIGGNGGSGGFGGNITDGYGIGGNAGTGGIGGYGGGGNGGYGIYLSSNANVYTQSGAITLRANIDTNEDGSAKLDINGAYIHKGGDGGSGFGGNGGAGGGTGQGGNGRSGIFVSDGSSVSNYYSSGEVAPIFGNITMIATGGNGGSGTGGDALVSGPGGSGFGGNGGTGIAIGGSNGPGYVYSHDGNITLKGYGGLGGFAKGGASAGAFDGGYAKGGDGGAGIKVLGYYANGDGSWTEYSDVTAQYGNISLTGIGGIGGYATGGVGGAAGGEAIGGVGGAGIVIGGSTDYGYANAKIRSNNDGYIYMYGKGGTGGWAKGGTGGSGFNGGKATGGAGGVGIELQGSYYEGSQYSVISTGSNYITLNGFGGSGGEATGGLPGSGGSRGDAVGGDGGFGLSMHYYAEVSNDTLPITLYGKGGDGGKATGGGSGFGSGTGGAGGTGLLLDEYVSVRSNYDYPNWSNGYTPAFFSGSIYLTGRGGDGGIGTGSPTSKGGQGGIGIHARSKYENTTVSTYSGMTLKGYGGAGGASSDAMGGDGGLGIKVEGHTNYPYDKSVFNAYDSLLEITANGGAGGVGIDTANIGAQGMGMQDDWTGGEGSVKSSSLILNSVGGVSLRGNVDTVTLTNSGSGDIDYTDANDNVPPYEVVVSAANSAPYDAVKDAGGAVYISSDNRDIVVGETGISATSSAYLSAYNGAVRQYTADDEQSFVSGIIKTPLLVTDSAYGTNLSNPLNEVGMFGAYNSNSGDITLVNSIPLTIDSDRFNSSTGSGWYGVVNDAGAVNITNSGSIALPLTYGAGIFATGDVTLQASGTAADITTGADSSDTAINSRGNVSLTAGRDILLGQNGNYGDIYTDDGSGSITLTAGRDVTIANETYLNSYDGSINITATTGAAKILTTAQVETLGGGLINITAGGSGGIQIDSDTIVAAPEITLTATSGAVTAGSDSVNSTGITAANLLTVNAATGITFTGDNQSPNVVLNNSTSGDVTYNSAVLAGLAVSGGNAGGNFTVTETAGAVSFGDTTVSGALNATSAGAITQSGVLDVTGTTTLAAAAASDITLDNVGNKFGGAVTITSGNNVKLSDADSLSVNGTIGNNLTTVAGTSTNLGATTVGGNLSVTAGGDITNDGDLAVTGTSIFTTANGQSVSVASSGNSFGGAISFVAGSGKLNNIAITNAGNLDLQALDITGALTVITGGDLTQSGVITAGATTLTGSNITLGSANVLGAITVNAGTGNVSITENDAITVAGITHTGNLTLNAGTNDITQSGAIAVGTGTANLTGSNITLGSANVLGAVTVNAGTGNVAITENDAITVAGITHTGTLALNAGTNDITQSGAITAGATTLTGSNITLGSANVLGAITVNAGTGDVSITENDAITVAGITHTGNLTLNAGTNDITQSGAIAVGTGTANLTGSNITLGSANVLGAITVNAGTGDVSITENDAITVADITHTGNLTLNAGTNDITQSGAITAGATTLTGSNITLGSNNVLGAITVNAGTGDVSITENDAITVTGITHSGNVTLTADTLAFNGTINSGAGNVTLKPLTPGTAIGVADATKAFNISDTMLGQITTTGTVVIGDAAAGALTAAVNGAINRPTLNLTLLSGNDITYDYGISANNLTLNAGGSIVGNSGYGGKLAAAGKLTLIAGVDIIASSDVTGTGGVLLNSGTSGMLDTSSGIISNNGSAADVVIASNNYNVGDINAGTASLTLTTSSPGETLSLGANSIISVISGGSLTFGDPLHTGDIVVTGAMVLDKPALFINGGGNILVNNLITSTSSPVTIDTHGINPATGVAATTGAITGSANITAPSLTLLASEGINLTGANAVGAVNLTNTGSGDVAFSGTNASGMTVSGTNAANFSVTNTSGSLNIGSINAGGGVTLTSSGGAINGSGSGVVITAGSAQLTSTGGIGTTAPFLTAVGTLAGASSGGSVNIENQGALTVTGQVTSTGGTVSVTTHSPLTINANVLGKGDVTLFAGASGSISDNLTIAPGVKVTSQTGNVLLKAGKIVTVSGQQLASTEDLIGSSSYDLYASMGKVIIRDNLNSPYTPPASLNTQNVVLLPGVSYVVNDGVGVMGREAADLTDADEDENTNVDEGGQNGTEFSALPYCN